MAERKVTGAKAALALAEKQDDFLSAVQVGITLVGVLSGVYGGAALTDDMAALIADVPLIGPYKETVAYAVIVASITYLSVILGELVPKQLALSSPERFACVVAPLMRILVVVAMPVVRLLSFSSAVILRLMGREPNQVPAVTEEDVNMIMHEAWKSGAIEEDQLDIAERALALADRPVTSVMTPRPAVVWLRIDASREEYFEIILHSGHSHLPVCSSGPDDVIGILLHKKAVKQLLGVGFSEDRAMREQQIHALLEPPVVVPNSANVADVVTVMKREKTHFAIVRDEFGGLDGIVTNHDLLQALVGFVPGDKLQLEAIVRREDSSLLVSGRAPLDEICRYLEVDLPSGGITTSVAGYLISATGSIPAVGQVVVRDNLRFEVMEKNGQRLDRILVSLLPQ